MGSIILCHKKKAGHPYEISRIHRRIYTMEELCYYLCNHLYLIDYTIMNKQLCDWLDEELELSELAESLRQMIEQHSSSEQFVVTILAHSSIYTTAELKRIQDVLEKLKNQKPIEKQKLKADNLLQSKAIRQAILIYRSIVQEEPDESMDKKFYGRVYANLGTAYGRLFLYKEAAEMYEAAYQICEEKSMLKAYLYACFRYMSDREYQELLQKSRMYREVDGCLQEEMRENEEKIKFVPEGDTLNQWKEQYRRSGMGE